MQLTEKHKLTHQPTSGISCICEQKKWCIVLVFCHFWMVKRGLEVTGGRDWKKNLLRATKNESCRKDCDESYLIKQLCIKKMNKVDFYLMVTSLYHSFFVFFCAVIRSIATGQCTHTLLQIKVQFPKFPTCSSPKNLSVNG